MESPLVRPVLTALTVSVRKFILHKPMVELSSTAIRARRADLRYLHENADSVLATEQRSPMSRPRSVPSCSSAI